MDLQNHIDVTWIAADVLGHLTSLATLVLQISRLYQDN